jgi:hypothetical protein
LELLQSAQTAAFRRCVCEIDGMAERQLWAVTDIRVDTKSVD